MKPSALLDVEGYYTELTAFLDRSVQERFVREQNRAMLLVDDDPVALIGRLRDYDPGAMQPKWIDRTDT
jgi:predicted Rossmann-fold nucleotide-binding protein